MSYKAILLGGQPLLREKEESLYSEAEKALESDSVYLADNLVDQARALGRENEDRINHCKKSIEKYSDEVKDSAFTNAADTLTEAGYKYFSDANAEYWEAALSTAEMISE